MKKTVFFLVIVISLGTSIYYCWAYKLSDDLGPATKHHLVQLRDDVEEIVHASEQRIVEKIETLLASNKQVNTAQSKG